MPQASEEDRQWARQKFGSIDPGAIEQFLRSKGWQISRDGYAMRNPRRTLEEDEINAMAFLVEEWDYAWIGR